ncbi:MAG: PD40 domain-containing protein [candidate division Zixibacteria bacterium]|nr:PD40 domain-containing protein [candidate division Zixibacteria bacterium]
MRSFKLLRTIHFVLVAAVCPFVFLACAGCDDDPLRPVSNLPACWKPLVADTARMGDTTGDTPIIPEPTTSTAQFGPAWSHSGAEVAYFSYYDSCNNRDPGIYVANAEVGARRRKLPVFGAFFKWMPGDTELMVNTGFGGGGELVIYNLLSDSITPLGIQTRFPIFDISDDGRYIYYEGEPAPQHQSASIYEYDLETGAEWAVVAGAGPAISPDGNLLAYSFGTFRVYNFSDSSITELPGGGIADWTPDGQNIVYADGIGKIFISDLLGNLREITGQHDLFGAFGPISVSPDNTTILYKHASMDYFEHIWKIQIDGASAVQFAQ